VFPYAVQHSYGGPRGLQRLVNACHEAGLAVILDVPYYRLGPETARLAALGPYTSNRAGSDSWAELNVDDDDGRHVREFVLGSLRQWVRDFHVDGLRLEAVPAFCDADRPRFLDEVRDAVRLEAEALGRHVHLIADSNLNDVRVLQPSQFGGYGLDAQWNNDFHHAVHALMTGERHGRYIDFGERDHLEKALNQTFVYDGCFSEHRRRSHGASADGLSGERFVISIQNHGEIGDRATGDRFGTMLHPGEQRLAAGLLLLAPYLPLIFMGQEYGETRRFPYFGSAGPQSAPADHGDARRRQSAPDPLAASTFESAKLAWSWPPDTWQEGLRELYADLLSARRSWPPLRDYVHRKAKFLGDKSSVLRLRRGDSARDRAYVLTAYFNFGNREEPLPRDDGGRVLLLSSESPRYAGTRTSDDRHDILLPFEFQVYLTNLADRR
jgi:maltooligosyltrehalose trehalohydrolase